tara:strand:- start:380 stop:1183 length:804 start_codon:yes stop_codon:yes gene_type:complete
MIVKEDLLKKLRAAFDLNIYEVKIWTALLCRGLATAGELSDMSQIPRSRSYDVLESLEKKGFVMMKLGKPIRYIAIDPIEIVRRIKDQVKEKSNDRMKFLDNIKKEDIFGELELLYKQGVKKVDSSILSGAVKGRDCVYTQMKGMFEGAQKEVIIVTSSDGLLRKMKKFRSVFGKLKNRGVKIKIAAPMGGLDNAIVKEIKSYATIKDVGNFDARFCIVDGGQVMFMVADDKDIHETYDSAVWINSNFFSKSFNSMFETMWNKLSVM